MGLKDIFAGKLNDEVAAARGLVLKAIGSIQEDLV